VSVNETVVNPRNHVNNGISNTNDVKLGLGHGKFSALELST